MTADVAAESAAEAPRGEPEVVVVPDAAAAGVEAATRLAALVADAVRRRGRADIATLGGSTPVGIYRAMVAEPLRSAIPWESLHVWFGDDRFVARGHADSNVAHVDAILRGGRHRSGSPLPGTNIHPWPVDLVVRAGGRAGECAAAYAYQLRAALPEDAVGRPVFDAVLVGVGPDGHLLSIFPGSPALDAPGWTAAVPAPTHMAPHVPRVTCTPAALDGAAALLVVAHGAAKAAVLARVLEGPRDVRALPAQLARRAGATWIVDVEAAARLVTA